MGDLRVSFPKPCSEAWEEMRPAGRARLCARCDKAVHDLSRHTIAETEALLRREPETCVRASIGADGVVALKGSRRDGARRMVFAAAVTAGLLATAERAMARAERPQGAISGSIRMDGSIVHVTATDAAGRSFRAKAGMKGDYRIKHLPAGTYRLTFKPSCGSTWSVDGVVVRDAMTSVPTTEGPDGCIIVGMLRIEDSRG
jgi:hypothetical protein